MYRTRNFVNGMDDRIWMKDQKSTI